MIQRQHRTQPGRFTPCPACGGEPRHVEHFGRSQRESMDRAIACHRHTLECACGRSTARHPSLDDAEAEWGAHLSENTLHLRGNVTRLRGRKPKAVTK